VIVGRVVGSLWSTACEPSFIGTKLMLVQPIHAGTREDAGNTVLAIDQAQSGMGDTVLVVYEGSSSRLVLGSERTPCEAVIVGIVDRIDTPSKSQIPPVEVPVKTRRIEHAV
jgi:microcompartment protein CcmK/EutM